MSTFLLVRKVVITDDNEFVHITIIDPQYVFNFIQVMCSYRNAVTDDLQAVMMLVKNLITGCVTKTNLSRKYVRINAIDDDNIFLFLLLFIIIL